MNSALFVVEKFFPTIYFKQCLQYFQNQLLKATSKCVQDYISKAFMSFVLSNSNIIPVDPAGGYCYRCLTKPCESNVLREHGVMLSNTWITCPQVRHNLGKLRIIPDISSLLESLEETKNFA